MEFGLTEEHRALQDAVVTFLDDQASLKKVQSILNGDDAAMEALRAGLNDLGANAILVPAKYGGLGLGLFEAALMFEALGRNVTPADFLGNTLAALAIRSNGSEGQREEWLTKIACGSVTFGVALSHLVSKREGAGVHAKDGRLSGKSLFALCPIEASHLLVADDSGALYVIERGAVGAEVLPLVSVDRTRELCVLVMNDVFAEQVQEGCDRFESTSVLLSAARVLVAADELGACQRMLELAVAYSHQRVQFGVPIGSFQAVKHMCAEMAAEIEPCRSLMWFAASSFDQRSAEMDVMACHVKSRLSDVGQFVARTATEVHGGVGFTDELGLHLWFKRLGLDRQVFGTPTQLRVEAARLQGWID